MKWLRLIERIKLNYAFMIKVQNASWAKCNFFLLNGFEFFFIKWLSYHLAIFHGSS